MSVSRREIIVVCLVSFLAVVASLFQLFVYIAQTLAGFLYPLVHNYEPDYYWYLSLIRQGWDGSLLVTSRYTPEFFKPQLVNTFFPFLGMIGRVVGATPMLMYTLARVFFGSTLLIAGFFLALKLFKDKKDRWMAFLFMMFGAPFWYRDGGVVKQVGEFWTGFDPLMRIPWLPHHLAANTFLIVTLISWIPFQKVKTSVRPAVLIFISAVITAWLNPASGMVLVFIAAGMMVFSLVSRARDARALIGFLTIGMGGTIPLLILYFLTNSVFPWTAFRDWERFVAYPVDAVRFMEILGLSGVAATLSLPIALNRKSFPWTMIVLWFLFPFIGLGVLQSVLPLSNGRYLQGAAYIPAALLCSLGIITAYHSLVKKGMYRKWMMPVAVIAFVLLTAPSFWSSIDRQLGYVGTNRYNPLVYVPNTSVDAFTWLNLHAKKDAVALAPLPVMTIIPALTSLRVVAGHPTFTLNPADKERDVTTFYYFSDIGLASRILKNYSVKYVWIERTHPASDSFLSGLSLERVFANPSVSLYAVK